MVVVVVAVVVAIDPQNQDKKEGAVATVANDAEDDDGQEEVAVHYYQESKYWGLHCCYYCYCYQDWNPIEVQDFAIAYQGQMGHGVESEYCHDASDVASNTQNQNLVREEHY